MKILHLDIETAPNLVYSWGLWNQNIAINQISEPGYTMCWAAKWHGERGTIFYGMEEDGPDKMVEEAHALLDEADVVVHYNGKKFDIPKLNQEFVLRGLAPPSSYKQIDLLPVVRSEFGFVSNKLDFVAQQLDLGAKTQHKGMDMWLACMEGDAAAWRVMKRYNIQDVRLLEKLYMRLLPWIRVHPNFALYQDPIDVVDPEKPVCKRCGSTDLVKNGHEYALTQKYQRYRCKSCLGESKGRRTLITKEERQRILA